MFQHLEIHFNYTTYDVRRASDVIRPSKPERANIMVLAPQDSVLHPANPEIAKSHFIYARVLGVYHVQAIYEGPGSPGYSPGRFDFLWVRWYELGDEPPYSLRSLTFLPCLAMSTFDFVDPEDVVRAAHIVPAFCDGKRNEASWSPIAGDGNDWCRYYVGR